MKTNISNHTVNWIHLTRTTRRKGTVMGEVSTLRRGCSDGVQPWPRSSVVAPSAASAVPTGATVRTVTAAHGRGGLADGRCLKLICVHLITNNLQKSYGFPCVWQTEDILGHSRSHQWMADLRLEYWVPHVPQEYSIWFLALPPLPISVFTHTLF